MVYIFSFKLSSKYYAGRYFCNYFYKNNNITLDFADNSAIQVHRATTEDWKVTIVNTGLDTMTGGRVKRIAPYIGNEPFFLTYGDGVQMTSEKKAAFLSGCGYFWSRIYRREFLNAHHLRFPENVYYEDAYFNFMTALYAETCGKAPGQYYHYYQSPDSTVRKNGTHQYERIAIPSLIIQDCRERGIYEEYKDLIDYKYITMQMGNVLYVCLSRFDKPDKGQLRRIADAVKTECPDFSKCKHYKKADWQLRVYLRLVLVSPTLAVAGKKLGRLIELAAIVRSKLRGR